MSAPLVSYAQIRDPALPLPGLPGVVDITLRTVQALAIAAINTPLPTPTPNPGSGAWRTRTVSQPGLPPDPTVPRLVRCLAAIVTQTAP